MSLMVKGENMARCSLCFKFINTKFDYYSYNTDSGDNHCSECLCLDDVNTIFYNKPDNSPTYEMENEFGDLENYYKFETL